MINYNNLIESVELVHKVELSQYKNLSDEEKRLRCVGFHGLLQSEDLFTLFINSKIKLFSSKTEETHLLSCSLFDENVCIVDCFR